MRPVPGKPAGSLREVSGARHGLACRELLAHFGLNALLDGGEVAGSGVVHQHVDVAEAPLGRLDGCGNLVQLGDVEPMEQPAMNRAGGSVKMK